MKKLAINLMKLKSNLIRFILSILLHIIRRIRLGFIRIINYSVRKWGESRFKVPSFNDPSFKKGLPQIVGLITLGLTIYTFNIKLYNATLVFGIITFLLLFNFLQDWFKKIYAYIILGFIAVVFLNYFNIQIITEKAPNILRFNPTDTQMQAILIGAYVFFTYLLFKKNSDSFNINRVPYFQVRQNRDGIHIQNMSPTPAKDIEINVFATKNKDTAEWRIKEEVLPIHFLKGRNSHHIKELEPNGLDGNNSAISFKNLFYEDFRVKWGYEEVDYDPDYKYFTNNVNSFNLYTVLEIRYKTDTGYDAPKKYVMFEYNIYPVNERVRFND